MGNCITYDSDPPSTVNNDANANDDAAIVIENVKAKEVQVSAIDTTFSLPSPLPEWPAGNSLQTSSSFLLSFHYFASYYYPLL